MLSPAAMRSAADHLRATLLRECADAGDTSACDALHSAAAILEDAANIVDAMATDDPIGAILNRNL